MMYELDLVKLNGSLVKAVRLCVAIRQFFGKEAVEHAHFMDLEREIRDAAAECQRVLALVEADENRPLIPG